MAEAALGTAPARAGRGGRLGRLPALVLGRLVEQASLGIGALFLAARLGPSAFAPVSVLFVVNSLAVTLSDYGIGLAALRCTPGTHVRAGVLRRMRVGNLAGAVLAAGAGLAAGGTAGTIVGLGGCVWWASGEAFVRKAAAINLGFAGEAAGGELAGAVVFGLVCAIAPGRHAVAIVGAAFVLKHALEAVAVRHWREVFSAAGCRPELGALWSTQGLALAAGNVDYLLVGAFFGARAFAVYTLGFRVAVALPSVLAYAAGRTAVADLGAAPTAAARGERYRAYVRPLFAAGVLGGLGAAATGLVLPAVLGPGWGGLTPTIAVLALAMPWRMVVGQAGALMVAVHSSARLARWEVARLAAFALLLAGGAAAGFGGFVVAASLGWIVLTTAQHWAAARVAEIEPWGSLRVLALAAVPLCVALGATLGTWP